MTTPVKLLDRTSGLYDMWRPLIFPLPIAFDSKGQSPQDDNLLVVRFPVVL